MVWSILTDLARYSEWNPFIQDAKGQIGMGERIEVCIAPPNGKAMLFKPTVISVVANKTLSWLGRLWFPGVFDGEHRFEIVPNESGCLFIQRENFSGLLVSLLWKSLDKEIRAGFEQMNLALKQRAENRMLAGS